MTPEEIAKRQKVLDKEIQYAHSKAEAARQRVIRSSDEASSLLDNLLNAFWRKRKTRLREEKNDYRYLSEIIESQN